MRSTGGLSRATTQTPPAPARTHCAPRTGSHYQEWQMDSFWGGQGGDGRIVAEERTGGGATQRLVGVPREWGGGQANRRLDEIAGGGRETREATRDCGWWVGGGQEGGGGARVHSCQMGSQTNMPNSLTKCATRMVGTGKHNGASGACMCMHHSRLRLVAYTGARPMHG